MHFQCIASFVICICELGYKVTFVLTLTLTDIADLYEFIVGSCGRPLYFHFIFYCVSLYTVLKVFFNQVNN